MTRETSGLVALVVLLLTSFTGALAVDAAGGETSDLDGRALRRLMSPPLGLPPVPLPEENLPTVEKIRLGRRLFFDRRLSINGTMSCGMCHIPEQGFTSHELERAVGLGGSSLPRNAPTILNVAYVEQLFHDGRETTLETQALGPPVAPEEMGLPSLGWLVRRVRALPGYEGAFRAALGGPPSVERIGEAIASWERTILSGNSPFDRWRYGGEAGALTPRARAGFALFTGRAGCSACHTVGEEHALFSDGKFHDTGIGHRSRSLRSLDAAPVRVEIAPGVSVPLDRAVLRTVGDPEPPDPGRSGITGDPRDRWRFRTPGLRNVALTRPYMHDGSLRSLEEVVRYYNSGGAPHAGLDPLIRPLELDEEEIQALVAFLESLDGDGLGELIRDARSAPVGDF